MGNVIMPYKENIIEEYKLDVQVNDTIPDYLLPKDVRSQFPSDTMLSMYISLDHVYRCKGKGFKKCCSWSSIDEDDHSNKGGTVTVCERDALIRWHQIVEKLPEPTQNKHRSLKVIKDLLNLNDQLPDRYKNRLSYF